MCRGAKHVRPEAQALLASVLSDITKALDPEHPEAVVIGPVDFGCADATSPSETCATDDPPNVLLGPEKDAR